MRGGASLVIAAVTLIGASAAPALAAPTHTPVMLLAPTWVSSSATASSITLTWTDPNKSESGYAVERRTTGAFAEVARPGRNKTFFTDKGLAAGTTYTYRARARGKRKTFSAFSAERSVTTQGSTVDTTKPTVPANLAATAPACDMVALTWSASSDSGGAGLRGYKLYRGTTLVKEIAVPATSTTDAGRSASTAYTYRVSAIDSANNESAQSSAASTTTPACPLPGGWAQREGGTGNEVARRTAVDASGNIYVVGNFTGTTNLGGATFASAGSGDAFVAKYAPDGTHLWSKRFGSGANDSAEDVAIDASGNLVVVGGFAQTVNFGGGARTSMGSGDIFIAKYAPDGSHLWSKTFGGADYDQALTVAIDGAGNIVVGGVFTMTASFGGAPLSTPYPTSNATDDVFLAKYTPNGDHVWSKEFLTSGVLGKINAVAADATGNIAITGDFVGAADFGGGEVWSNQASVDGFVAMLAPTGVHRWSRSFGGSSADSGDGITFDSAGNVVVVGGFASAVDFGGGPLAGDGGGNGFVAKYTNTGRHLWSRALGGKLTNDSATDVALGSGDAVAITGYFGATDAWPASFGGPSFSGLGGRDVFVAKYTAAGAHVWSEMYGGAGNENASGIALDAAGAVVVVGGLSEPATFNGRSLTSAGGVDVFLMKLER